MYIQIFRSGIRGVLCCSGKKKTRILKREGENSYLVPLMLKFPGESFIIRGQSATKRVGGADDDNMFIFRHEVQAVFQESLIFSSIIYLLRSGAFLVMSSPRNPARNSWVPITKEMMPTKNMGLSVIL